MEHKICEIKTGNQGHFGVRHTVTCPSFLCQFASKRLQLSIETVQTEAATGHCNGPCTTIRRLRPSSKPNQLAASPRERRPAERCLQRLSGNRNGTEGPSRSFFNKNLSNLSLNIQAFADVAWPTFLHTFSLDQGALVRQKFHDLHLTQLTKD